MEGNCRDCENGKNRYKDFFYCSLYGYTRSKPKDNCYGWEIRKEPEKREDKQGEKG